MPLFFRPRPAGIADTLYQVRYFDRLCEFIGFRLDYNFVSAPDSRRNKTEDSVQDLLFGPDPLREYDQASILVKTFTEFFKICESGDLSALSTHKTILVTPRGCAQYLYDDRKHRRRLFAEKRFRPSKRNYRFLLQDGLIYQRYLKAKQTQAPTRKLVLHMRIGDCGIVAKEEIEDPAIVRLFEKSHLCWEGFVGQEQLESLDERRTQRLLQPHSYLDKLNKVVTAHSEPFDEIIICSDGYTFLAEKLWRTRRNRRYGFLGGKHELSREHIEAGMNNELFKLFDSVSPRYLIGESPDLFNETVMSFLTASTLIKGVSGFPTSLIKAFGLPMPEVYQVQA